MKAAIGILGMLALNAAGWAQENNELAIEHPDCIFFGAKADHFSPLKFLDGAGGRTARLDGAQA